MKKSALSENCKVVSLSQDLVRRMSNTSERLQVEERIEVLDGYVDKLVGPGYRTEQIRTTVLAGWRGSEKRVARARARKGKLHRNAAEGAGSRAKNKLLEGRNQGDECKEQG